MSQPSRCRLISLLLVLMPALALAQQDQGAITGIVTDASGGALAGASVSAVNRATNVITVTVTNQKGAYTLGPLLIGRYSIAVALDGFKAAEVEALELHAQSRVRVDVRLELGARAEKVVVTAETPLLERETSSLSYVVQEKEIKELPMNTRNFQELAVLAGGVLPAQGHRDQEGGFNAHGQWATQNNFILDGIDNNAHIMGMADRKAQILIPSLDAVQEFSIQTSNYSAEFGRAGAVMNVSIKSGTNGYHGTVYEFMRGDQLDARGAFDYNDRDGDGKADAEHLNQHQFGFTLGGPLARNKTFFFTSLEALKSDSTRSALLTVPTLDERNGRFSPALVTVKDPVTGLPFPGNVIPRDRWDPVAARLVALYPEPNFAGGTRDNYTTSIPVGVDRYQADTRLDHHFSDRDRAFVRFSYLNFREDNPGPFPVPAVGAATVDEARSRDDALSLVLSETHFFGSTLVNEVRVGFNRSKVENLTFSDGYPNEELGIKIPREPGITGLSRIVLAGTYTYRLLGESIFTPLRKTSRTFQILDNVTLARGRHSFKGGIDFRWIRSTADGAATTKGVFNFNGKFTGHSLGDMLLGMTNTIQLSSRQDFDMSGQDYLFYVQDDWRVSKRLTLNLGLRYELSCPLSEAQDRMSTLDLGVFPSEVRILGVQDDSWSGRALVKTDTDNIAPRLGFAWQPASKWTLRGAAGLFYGTPFGSVSEVSRMVFNWPFFRNVTRRSTPTSSAGQLKDGVDDTFLGSTTVMPADLTLQVWAQDFPSPTIYQWNLSVQRQLAASLVATVSYVGSNSEKLPRVYNVNNAPIGPPATERQRRPAPTLGQLLLREPSGSSAYHGLETTIDKRFSSGVRFSLAHTWSHSIDDVEELFGAEGPLIQDTRNLDADRGNSGFDRRHRVAGSWLVELPFGRGRRLLNGGSVLSAILGGWQLSGLVAWQTGRYFHVTLPDPTTLLGVSQSTWRADRVAGVDPYPSDQSADKWLNKDAFAVPQNQGGAYRFGNMGRNSLIGPGFYSVDLGLSRSFRVAKDKQIQVRVEAFNATNHPSYGLPVSNLTSPDFGTISTTVSTPRQLQFGVKFLF